MSVFTTRGASLIPTLNVEWPTLSATGFSVHLCADEGHEGHAVPGSLAPPDYVDIEYPVYRVIRFLPHVNYFCRLWTRRWSRPTPAADANCSATLKWRRANSTAPRSQRAGNGYLATGPTSRYCTRYGVPLAQIVTLGNESDMNYLKPLVEKLRWRPEVVIADRGYDSKYDAEWLHRRDSTPVIYKTRPPRGFHTRGRGRKYYSTRGTPLCECMSTRPFISIDPGTGERVYWPVQD